MAADVDATPKAKRLTTQGRGVGLTKMEAKAGRHALDPLVAMLQLPGDERDAQVPAAAACARAMRCFQQVPAAVLAELLRSGKHLTPAKYSKVPPCPRLASRTSLLVGSGCNRL